MCGIVGLLSTQLDQPIVGVKLAAMQNALNHRGLDGRGDYFAPSKNAALAHTRLAIIDLSDSGAQPMSILHGRYTISFNGEIYNYQALRSDLETLGPRFVSNSDTEVILALYARYGAESLHKLRGMFAFVIWDEGQQIGFAARDPLGIKPLYYWHDEATLAVASELRAIVAAGLSKQTLDPQGLSSYLQTGTVSKPHTLLRDVKLLPAGHNLSWADGRLSVIPYWAIDFKPQPLEYLAMQQRTREALKDSIKAHFVADVPIGVFLSGGINSTALVALAIKATKQKINTYSIAFEDPEWNEGDIARRVAEHFGTNHTELVMTAELAKPLFDQFLHAIDQPMTDGFNTFCVAKLAHDCGEKVGLSGLDGDELRAGYKSFKVLPKMVRNSRRLALLRWPINLLEKISNKVVPAKLRRVFDFLRWPGSLSAAHTSLRRIFSSTEATALGQLLCNTLSASLTHKKMSGDPANAVIEVELTTYMRNQLLRDSDLASMAWGLELRVPFVDRVLIDTLSSIPSAQRLQYGKPLLIDAVPELPEWVINRPKQGFAFPFDQWFSDHWRDIPLTQTVPSWIKLEPWYRKWSLILFNHWAQRYVK
ncbi:MAG: asparagine synthase (glutamine-hydrolyzing) [Cryomorphaceae bacterium]|jgi:asparagine synthase (glutamine-hydrolysing)